MIVASLSESFPEAYPVSVKSQTLRQNPLEGIQTVEAKDIDLDFLGHSYLFEAREVLKDRASVLFRRLSPSDAGRGLKPGRNADGSPFWVLDSSTR